MMAVPCASMPTEDAEPPSNIHCITGFVLESILAKARGPRRIPGTNKYARVCRSWHQASTRSSSAEEEQLQLYLDPSRMDSSSLDACLAWAQQHGACVTGLTIERGNWPYFEQCLFQPIIFSSSLTHLELAGTNLLSLLPYVQQLPALQHLATRVMCVTTADPWQLQDGSGNPADIPDMGQLCPQLVSLRLAVQVEGARRLDSQGHYAQPRLLQLLPSSLQQLELEAFTILMDGAHFTHLTALSQLTLNIKYLANNGHLAGMTGLQRLRLSLEGLRLMESIRYRNTLPLASKLVEVTGTHGCCALLLGEACQLTQLTALCLSERDLPGGPEEHGRREVHPLASLTSLRTLHLSVQNFVRRKGGFLCHGLSSISSLRTLMLSGDVSGCSMYAVAELTQLTGLWLNVGAGRGDQEYVQHSITHVLHQLTNLQLLFIGHSWLVPDSMMLANLQQLTVLIVSVQTPSVVDAPPPVEVLVQPLRGCHNPRLQEVALIHYGIVAANGGASDEMEVVPSPLPGVTVRLCRSKSPYWHAVMRPRQLRPCPHLASVYEVVSQV